MNAYTHIMYQVLFSGADSVVPTIATAPVSDDDESDFDMASPD